MIPPVQQDPLLEAAGPDFILHWEAEGGEPKRWFRAGVGSIIVHILLVVLAFGIAQIPNTPNRPERAKETYTKTTLVMPQLQLTQREPNRGKLTKEFNLESIPRHQTSRNFPSPGAAELPSQSTPKPVQKFVPPAPTRAANPTPAMPEAPAINTSQARAPSAPPPTLGVEQPIAPPKIQAEEKPKLAFETPGVSSGVSSGLGHIEVPKDTMADTIRRAARSAGSSHLTVGDDVDSIGPSGLTAPRTQLPGKLGSNLELLSDPQGVDLSPYLIKVLAAVRRNWFAVIPESVRLGRAGKTVIQFAISSNGGVPKLVIIMPSGTESLDRAAVAGISASNPFPPLPPEFHGGQIRLQLNFLYNGPGR
jgi:TonB family protein